MARNSMWFVFASIVIGLAGCSSAPSRDSAVGTARTASKGPDATFYFMGDVPPADATRLPCLGSCLVTVTVDGDCNITVFPAVLGLVGVGSSQYKIGWVIGNFGYEFPAPGVAPAVVTNKSGTADMQFGPTTIHWSSAVASLTFSANPSTPGKYHAYGLNVVRKSDGKVCSTDPWVIE
jgi:hypothetical protein